MNIPGHSTRNGYFLHREIYMRLVLRTNSLCIAMSRAPFTAAASPSGLPGITGNVLNGYAVLIGGSTNRRWIFFRVHRYLQYQCVGPSDEWHLDLANALCHLAFHLGAGLGQPVVVIAPPLFQPRLVPIRPIRHTMSGDGAEEVLVQSQALFSVLGGLKLKHWLKCFQRLHGAFEADGAGQDLGPRRNLSDQSAN